MKIYDYMTQGTCSQAIHIELNDDNTINNVSFTGGCNGNLKGIGKLVEGMPRLDIFILFHNSFILSR